MCIEYFAGGMLVGLGNQRQQWTSAVEPQSTPPLHIYISSWPAVTHCCLLFQPQPLQSACLSLLNHWSGVSVGALKKRLQTQAGVHFTASDTGIYAHRLLCRHKQTTSNMPFWKCQRFFLHFVAFVKKARDAPQYLLIVCVCPPNVTLDSAWCPQAVNMVSKMTTSDLQVKWNCKFWRCSPPLVDIKTSTEEPSLFLKLIWCLRLYENIHFVSLYFLHWFSINGTIGKYSLATVFWKRQQKLAICVRHKTVWPLALSGSRNGDCC